MKPLEKIGITNIETYNSSDLILKSNNFKEKDGVDLSQASHENNSTPTISQEKIKIIDEYSESIGMAQKYFDGKKDDTHLVVPADIKLITECSTKEILLDNVVPLLENTDENDQRRDAKQTQSSESLIDETVAVNKLKSESKYDGENLAEDKSNPFGDINHRKIEEPKEENDSTIMVSDSIVMQNFHLEDIKSPCVTEPNFIRDVEQTYPAGYLNIEPVAVDNTESKCVGEGSIESFIVTLIFDSIISNEEEAKEPSEVNTEEMKHSSTSEQFKDILETVSESIETAKNYLKDVNHLETQIGITDNNIDDIRGDSNQIDPSESISDETVSAEIFDPDIASNTLLEAESNRDVVGPVEEYISEEILKRLDYIVNKKEDENEKSTESKHIKGLSTSEQFTDILDTVSVSITTAMKYLDDVKKFESQLSKSETDLDDNGEDSIQNKLSGSLKDTNLQKDNCNLEIDSELGLVSESICKEESSIEDFVLQEINKLLDKIESYKYEETLESDDLKREENIPVSQICKATDFDKNAKKKSSTSKEFTGFLETVSESIATAKIYIDNINKSETHLFVNINDLSEDSKQDDEDEKTAEDNFDMELFLLSESKSDLEGSVEDFILEDILQLLDDIVSKISEKSIENCIVPAALKENQMKHTIEINNFIKEDIKISSTSQEFKDILETVSEFISTANNYLNDIKKGGNKDSLDEEQTGTNENEIIAADNSDMEIVPELTPLSESKCDTEGSIEDFIKGELRQLLDDVVGKKGEKGKETHLVPDVIILRSNDIIVNQTSDESLIQDINVSSTSQQFKDIVETISGSISTAKTYLEDVKGLETEDVAEDKLGNLRRDSNQMDDEKLPINNFNSDIDQLDLEEKENKQVGMNSDFPTQYDLCLLETKISPQSFKDNSKIEVDVISVLENRHENESYQLETAADDIVASPDKKVHIINEQQIDRQNKEEVQISEKTEALDRKASCETPLVADIRHNIRANDVSKQITPNFCVRARPHLWMMLFSRRRN